jgi:uncharacterized protein YgiM (DUF1202 family)
MNIHKLILLLAIPQIACMTTIPIMPTPEPTGTATNKAYLVQTSEPESGAVFEPQEQPTATAQSLCVTAIQAVNIRQQPSADSIIIGWLMNGEQVEAQSQSGLWTSTTAGFVKSEYLGECKQ